MRDDTIRGTMEKTMPKKFAIAAIETNRKAGSSAHGKS
jgi:hypothetical protein